MPGTDPQLICGKFDCHYTVLDRHTAQVEIPIYVNDMGHSWRGTPLGHHVRRTVRRVNKRYREELFPLVDDGLCIKMVLNLHIATGKTVMDVLRRDMFLDLFYNLAILENRILETPQLRDALGQLAHAGAVMPQQLIASDSAQWTDVRQYTEGLVAVADENGLYGFLEHNAFLAIPCRWAYAQPFSEGLAAVESHDGRYGFIDRQGKVQIPCEWNGATWFSEGLAAVMNADSEWGFIDHYGRLVIPCAWAETGDFRHHRATVYDVDGHEYVIDRQGRIVECVT